jgi:hypothetical protein
MLITAREQDGCIYKSVDAHLLLAVYLPHGRIAGLVSLMVGTLHVLNHPAHCGLFPVSRKNIDILEMIKTTTHYETCGLFYRMHVHE